MSQAQDILDYLWTGNTLTPLEALDKFKCFRLASRIHELRRAGYDIQTENPNESDKEYAVYRLIGFSGEKSEIGSPYGLDRRASGDVLGDISHSAPPSKYTKQADFLTNSILNDKAS